MIDQTSLPARRAVLLPAFLLTLATLLAANGPARAQVVCEDNGGGGASGAVAGTDAVACGPNANANNDEAIGIGHNVEATGDAAIAIGSDANDSGIGTRASGLHAIAIGTDADADADHAVAIGDYADAGSTGAVAIGGDADGDGQGALASGTAAIALGDNSRALGTGSIAIGEDSSGSNGGVSVGANSRATASDAAAFGNGAIVTHTQSVAIGSGATSTRANQIVLGTSSETYTMPGLSSAASAAAQSGPIEVVTTDAEGNLATDGGVLFASLAGAVPDLQDDIDTNRDGVALAMAMQVPYVPPSKTFALSSGLGFFEGATAFSVSTGWRINPSTQLDAGLGYGFNTDALGGRVGVTVSW